MFLMNRRLIITLGIGLFLVITTFIAIRFAKGYRFSLKDKKISGTGLLVANSFPKGAQVFINDKLTTATDDTLNLPPADYKIRIVKDGYIPWEKTLKLQNELVTQTNSQLFPAVPDLKALTGSGVLNLTPSPDGQKISYAVASASASAKNGLWILELASSPLAIPREPRQIAQSTTIFDFSVAQLIWSPNSKQILAKTATDSVLLDAERLNDPQSFKDTTARLSLIIKEWEEELDLKKKRQWEKLPEVMQTILQNYSTNIYFSPDEEKVLYTATASSQIKEDLIPSLPASNTQTEERSLSPGKIYVYDRKEDKNFYLTDFVNQVSPTPKPKKKLTTQEEEALSLTARLQAIQNQYSPLATQAIQWFPTSAHLILTEPGKIIITEYDSTNRATVYAGPFENSFVYPWPDGSKLLILASLNPESSLSPNLYAINLK